MSSYLMTRVRMGERSGYTTGWCDVPHWGLVTAGRMAIEWEDDVEILSTGDIFHCPAGPPGHRLEAADPATFVDLTPIAALADGGRVAEWRREWTSAAGPPRAASRWPRSSDRVAGQPGTAPRPSPASGSDRSYSSRVSSSGVSIAAGSWATGDSRACSRASTISIDATIGDRQEGADEAADRRTDEQAQEDQQRRQPDRVAHDHRDEDAAFDELDDDVDPGHDDRQLG